MYYSDCIRKSVFSSFNCQIFSYFDQWFSSGHINLSGLLYSFQCIVLTVYDQKWNICHNMFNQ